MSEQVTHIVHPSSDQSRIDALVLGALIAIVGLGISVFPGVAPDERAIAHDEDTAEIELPAETLRGRLSDDTPYIEPSASEETSTSAPNARAIQPVLLPQPPVDFDPIPSGPGLITLFGTGHNETAWHLANHSNEKSFQANDWASENVRFSATGLALEIGKGAVGGQPYNGAEVKSQDTYGYGRYEVMMRPARGSGLVSSFFTYTGPYFGDPHDEIDIEFLGQDTRQVELNYFKDGVVGASAVIELPFDAADALHIYAFEWWPDKILWYVDGDLIHQTPDGDQTIPRTPGAVHMNLWTGRSAGLRAWHGQPDFDLGTRADYACVSFTPLGETGRQCSDIFATPEDSFYTKFISWIQSIGADLGLVMPKE